MICTAKKKSAGKPGVLIYFDVADAIKGFDLTVKGELLTAILQYGQFRTVPELSDTARGAFAFIRQKIDADSARYAEVVKSRQDAGSKGGKAKRGNLMDAEANLANANFATKTEANLANANFATKTRKNPGKGSQLSTCNHQPAIINSESLGDAAAPPAPAKPKAELWEEMLSGYSFPADVAEKIRDWAGYCDESCKPYTRSNIKAMLNNVQKAVTEYSPAAACEVIDYSLSNSYPALYFDRLQRAAPATSTQSSQPLECAPLEDPFAAAVAQGQVNFD